MRPHRITIYRDARGKWRWNRKAGNHRIVAASSQGYRSRWYCTRKAVKQTPAGVDYIVEVEQ